MITWTTDQDTIHADKVNLFLYFREFAAGEISVSDGVLRSVCEAAREVMTSKAVKEN